VAKPEAWELLFQFSNGELSIHQLRAQLKDLGWSDDEVDAALDDDMEG
jgi:hypothetical protein